MEKKPWKTEDWFVSPYNYTDKVREKITLPEKVTFHDVTLRDGEQQAGIILRINKKIEIAKVLDDLGVQRIEAGMPAISEEDAKAVKAIAAEGLEAKVFAFARCMKKDVDAALGCDVDGVIMEVPSSDHLIKYAYGWTTEKAVNLSIEATTYAAEHGLHVAFFTIDSTRAQFDNFWRIVQNVATNGHMDSYVLVDTFGVCSPEAISYLVSEVKKRIDRPVEIHCHNDFGLGVANSLAGIKAGAEIVHTTVNGIGERSGNASLEEIVASLELLYGFNTGISLRKLRGLSKIVEKSSGIAVPPHKPIVGEKLFTTESGIIAGWWEKASKAGQPLEVYPFSPEFLGFDNVNIVLGKGSGQASVKYRLRKLGLKTPSKGKTDKILQEVKKTSEKKGRLVTDQEFITIVKRIRDS